MQYYVYILANKRNSVLYIGVTNDLVRRVRQHREKSIDGFTRKYNVTKLVHYETFRDVRTAIGREKQLKNWHRAWKANLIAERNPRWNDLWEELWADARQTEPQG